MTHMMERVAVSVVPEGELEPMRPPEGAELIPDKSDLRERRGRVRRAVGMVALGTALATGLFLTEVQRDIEAGKARVADAHSSIHMIYDADDAKHDDTATIVATGLGTKNPSETARLLTPYQKMGAVYALEYSNSDINIEELAQTTEGQLRRDGISYLNLDGFSAGGPILAAMAVELAHDMPDLTILSISMNSSPIGPDSLTASSRDAADILQAVLRVDRDLIYSEKARVVAEVAARHDRYTKANFPFVEVDDLRREFDDVFDTKYANPNAASAALIASQYRFLTAYNVDATMESLANLDHPPLIVYTRAANPNDDTVVRVEASEANLANYAQKYKVPLLTLRLVGAGHANPGEATEVYNAGADTEIIPAIMVRMKNNKAPSEMELALVLPPGR